MAELIPLQYRFFVLRRRQFRRWSAILTGVAVLAGSSLLFAFGWQQKRSSEYNGLSEEYRSKSVLITQARELQARRLDLAARMQKMEHLMDDTLLISMLRNVSSSFSGNDLLSYISIDAHGDQSASAKASSDDYRYFVHITGVTANDTTHADFINRLSEAGAKGEPRLTVTPESLRREKFFDGQVMRFQVVGEKPAGS
jgi:hypothetical protein